jgi:hypothetical protein
VRDLFLRIKQGDVVRFPVNNVSKAGNVIASAPTRKEAVHAAETAVRALLVRLEAPNETTASFLESGDATGNIFPPSAYAISSEMKKLLEKIPSGIEKSTLCLYNKVTPKKNAGQSLSIITFPEFETSELMDWLGRSVQETLDAVRTLTGLALPVKKREDVFSGTGLGRCFWKALIRGGYQGAVYLIDSLMTSGLIG